MTLPALGCNKSLRTRDTVVVLLFATKNKPSLVR